MMLNKISPEKTKEHLDNMFPTMIEAARAFGVSSVTISAWRADGVPSGRVHEFQLMIRKIALMNYVAANPNMPKLILSLYYSIIQSNENHTLEAIDELIESYLDRKMYKELAYAYILKLGFSSLSSCEIDVVGCGELAEQAMRAVTDDEIYSDTLFQPAVMNAIIYSRFSESLLDDNHAIRKDLVRKAIYMAEELHHHTPSTEAQAHITANILEMESHIGNHVSIAQRYKDLEDKIGRKTALKKVLLDESFSRVVSILNLGGKQ